VKVFQQLVNILKDKPKLMHGVNLSLAQLQANLGQQMFKAFQNKVRLGMDKEAQEMRDKSVKAYMQCIETVELVLRNPEDPEKISLPLRLKGIAAQRLANLLLSQAEKYLTIALDAYMQLPLDFPTEIYEVRRKRAIHTRDYAAKVAQLKEALRNAPPGTDTSRVEEDIRDFMRHIARQEADGLRAQGKLAEALARIEPSMTGAEPVMFAARGKIYIDMAAKAAGEERNQLLRKAAADFARALGEPEALLKAARLYWEDEALMFEPGRIASARAALLKATQSLESGLNNMVPEDPAYKPALAMQKEAAALRKQMDDLGTQHLRAARLLARDGKLEEAAGHAEQAVEILGDIVLAWHQLARVRRDLGRQKKAAKDAAATRWLEDSRSAYEAALKLEAPLHSQKLELLYELAELLLDDLGDSKSARDWVYIAGQVLKDAPEEVRPELEKAWAQRLAELGKRAGAR
jgi:hypothetical protein